MRPFQAAQSRSLGARQDPRELPLYDVSEAALFVGVAAAALDAWMGRTSDGSSGSSLLQVPEPSSGRLSFANLAEAHILAVTQWHDIPTSQVRRALDILRARNGGTPYPLLSREFRLRGKRQFVESLVPGNRCNDMPEGCIERRSMLAADLDRHLERIECDVNDDPYQLFPMRRNEKRYIALNINLAAGHPVIAGTGLRVAYLSDLVRGGMSVRRVARRYELHETTVAAALAFVAA